MSYRISVEPDKLKEMAKAVNDYRTCHTSKMSELRNSVSSLQQKNLGAEFTAFQQSWTTVAGQGSDSEKMVTCTKNYADYLNYAAQLYITIQSNAEIRASLV